MEKSNVGLYYEPIECRVDSPKWLNAVLFELKFMPHQFEPEGPPRHHQYMLTPQQARDIAKLLIEQADEADRMSAEDPE